VRTVDYDGMMTPRAWLTAELTSAVIFAIPTVVFTMAGARHVAFYGVSLVSYGLSVAWVWGPALLLTLATLLQARAGYIRIGWTLSVLAAVPMAFLSVLALARLAREGGGHWSLWIMWIGAAAATVFTIAGTIALAPSRRLRGEVRPL